MHNSQKDRCLHGVGPGTLDKQTPLATFSASGCRPAVEKTALAFCNIPVSPSLCLLGRISSRSPRRMMHGCMQLSGDSMIDARWQALQEASSCRSTHHVHRLQNWKVRLSLISQMSCHSAWCQHAEASTRKIWSYFVLATLLLHQTVSSSMSCITCTLSSAARIMFGRFCLWLHGQTLTAHQGPRQLSPVLGCLV